MGEDFDARLSCRSLGRNQRERIGLGCDTVQGLSVTDYTKQGRTQGGELEVEAQQIKEKTRTQNGSKVNAGGGQLRDLA